MQLCTSTQKFTTICCQKVVSNFWHNNPVLSPASLCVWTPKYFSLLLLQAWRYGDSAGNTVEENSSIFFDPNVLSVSNSGGTTPGRVRSNDLAEKLTLLHWLSPWLSKLDQKSKIKKNSLSDCACQQSTICIKTTSGESAVSSIASWPPTRLTCLASATCTWLFWRPGTATGQQGNAGSKTMLQQNTLLLNSGAAG